MIAEGMGSVNPVDCGAGVRLERGVQCRLKDGVVLYSDHYYPAEDGPHPTLLMRQPYGRDIASTVVYAHPAWFARHGYNVVIQDVRGRGDSEGSFYPFRHERADGAETIRWLRSRPESNGKVGMYGFSYQGLTQLLAAAEQPEGLLCIAPAMTACDLYHGWFYHHGALRLASALGWGLQMLKSDARRLHLSDAGDKLESAWMNLRMQPLITPYATHPALRDKSLPCYVSDWFEHDTPGDYWTAQDISKSLREINIPALHLSGWYDTYVKGSVDGFIALAENAGSEFARNNQYLIAGPWIHIPWGDVVGESNFGSDALLDTDLLLLKWFNHWLKESGEFSAEPRIRHFALGANRWFNAQDWPKDEAVVFFLHSNGRANSRKGDGSLTVTGPVAIEAPDVFVYDPEVPVLAPGGAASLSGSANQATLELGNNLLVYTTSPLLESLHVFGTAAVTIYCSTSATSADLTAKLVRVSPDGRADYICMGIARSSFLFPASTYFADKIQRWHFTLEPTSSVFAAGESLRLEIASSAFPLYDRNPSTSVKPCQAEPWNWARSTQIIWHDAEHPSALYLPVITEAVG